MNILPFNTLPDRARSRLNDVIIFPLKTWCVYSYAFLRAYRQNGFTSKTLLAYPEKPKTYHVLYKVCKSLGWAITDNPHKKADLAIYFEDTTVRNACPELATIEKRLPVLNRHCTNISKDYIDEIFSEVFGYRMRIDPHTHTGQCVRKSKTNAVHDGVVIDCPTEPEEGYVYQKLIDSSCGDGRVMDIRIPVLRDAIPFLMKRYKSTDDIFNITIGAELAETDDLLSKDEQEKIIIYCKKLGLEYGELDAMRDTQDGKLYIVDVNNTPAGPIGPLYESKEAIALWIKKNCDAFEKHLVQKN